MDKTNTVMAEIVDGVDLMCLCCLPALKFCFGDFSPPGLPLMKNGDLRLSLECS